MNQQVQVLHHIERIDLLSCDRSSSLTTPAHLGIFLPKHSNEQNNNQNRRRGLLFQVLHIGNRQGHQNNNDDNNNNNNSSSDEGNAVTVFKAFKSEEELRQVMQDIGCINKCSTMSATNNKNNNGRTASSALDPLVDNFVSLLQSTTAAAATDDGDEGKKKGSNNNSSSRQTDSSYSKNHRDGNDDDTTCHTDANNNYQGLQMTFQWVSRPSSGNGPSSKSAIEMKILQHLPDGLTRKCRICELESITEEAPPPPPPSSPPSAITTRTGTPFCFIESMVDSTRCLQDRIELLLSRQRAQDGAVSQWKDTAEKLSGEWELEKSGMLQNFVDLYSEKQSQVTALREQTKALQDELDETKEELEKQKAATAAAASNAVHHKQSSRKQQQRGLSSPIKDIRDDYDHEGFDEDFVAQMAAGKKTKLTATTTRRRRKRSRDGTDLNNNRNKKVLFQKNETTGAYKYYDASAVLDDPELFPPPQNAGNEAKITDHTPGDHQDAKMSSENNKESDNNNNNGDGDGDESDEGHDPIDPKTRSFILSTLDILNQEDERKANDRATRGIL